MQVQLDGSVKMELNLLLESVLLKSIKKTCEFILELELSRVQILIPSGMKSTLNCVTGNRFWSPRERQRRPLEYALG